MDICYCEIEQRWPKTFRERAEMLQELDRRGIITSVMANKHGVYERVWKSR